MSEQIFDCTTRGRIDCPKELIDFYNDIEAVCKKHGFSISHEDGHGSFEIERYDDFLMRMLRLANKNY